VIAGPVVSSIQVFVSLRPSTNSWTQQLPMPTRATTYPLLKASLTSWKRSLRCHLRRQRLALELTRLLLLATLPHFLRFFRPRRSCPPLTCLTLTLALCAHPIRLYLRSKPCCHTWTISMQRTPKSPIQFSSPCPSASVHTAMAVLTQHAVHLA
jgi:hypothetical protein